MSHETLIHRVDAEQSHGGVTTADPDLCADGIDELLSLFLGGAPEWSATEQGEGVIEIAFPIESGSIGVTSIQARQSPAQSSNANRFTVGLMEKLRRPAV